MEKINDYKEILSIIEELENASTAYYNGDDSTLTDEEFDTKQDYLDYIYDAIDDKAILKRIDALLGDNNVLLGGTSNITKEVKHSNPMLSLAKAKTNDELKKFLVKLSENGAEGFSLQLKLDGFAMSAIYQNGKLKSLSTRGDGTIGEDVSYLVTADDVLVLGLPTEIPTKDSKIEVRGELFLDEDQFRSVNTLRFKQTGEEFKNSRNAVVGLMKKAEKGVDYPVTFTFAAYSIFQNDKPVNFDTDYYSSSFVGVDFLTRDSIADSVDSFPYENIKTIEETLDAVNRFRVIREHGLHYPTDGVVIKPSNEAFMHHKMGNTSHHPASQIAYKYPAPTGESKIIDIVLSVGKTGKVTPRAVIEPVDLMGTIIRNVSLHNFDWMNERGIKVNSKVAVTRANDVIPYIKSVIVNPDDSYEFEVPKTCPSCSNELISEDGVWPPKTLRCNNFDCPSRDIFSLRSAVGKNYLNIDGMSEVSIDSLNDDGVLNDISDLYNLDLEVLANSTLGYSSSGNPRRLGEKRAQNILNHIEKSKTLPLYKLLASLSIQGLGPIIAKDLINEFQSFENIANASEEELLKIDGFGEIRAKQVYEGLKQKAALIERLIESGVEFNKDVENSKAVKSNISGKSFAISGPVPEGYGNRNSWVEWLESQGAVFHSSPKEITDYIIADETGSSSKVKKAIKLGITFITADKFNELL